jgi:hypothetical protein
MFLWNARTVSKLRGARLNRQHNCFSAIRAAELPCKNDSRSTQRPAHAVCCWIYRFQDKNRSSRLSGSSYCDGASRSSAAALRVNVRR